MRLRLFAAFIALIFWAGSVSAQTATIAVAANMKDAFTQILAEFKTLDSSGLKVVYGSSGNLSTQILNGAPFDLFVAADEQFPLELYKSGKTLDEGALYAVGKLVLVTKASSQIDLLNTKSGITNAIAKANKVAIAKPELSPYGKAAVEYLKAEGLWDKAKGKLVYGDNIGAATTYVLTGAADLGFTALSLAKSDVIAKETRFLLLDAKFYQPIKQRMVLMKGAPLEVVNLYRFIQSPQGKTILQKYGYTTP